MKCFSLTTKPRLVRGSPGACNGGPCGRGGCNAAQNYYPRPRAGIDLDPTDRCVVVGWTVRVPVSQALLDQPPSSGAIERDGRRVTVLRASVNKDAAGTMQLVPERTDDREGAIVLLDVGAGRYLNLRYQNLDKQLRPDQIVARVKIADSFGIQDEKLLVQVKPWEPLVAVRSDKRWWLWGQERVRETLNIRFDGRSLFYDTPESRD